MYRRTGVTSSRVFILYYEESLRVCFVLLELRQACSLHTPFSFSLASWTPLVINTTGIGALRFYHNISGAEAHAPISQLTPTDAVGFLLAVWRNSAAAYHTPHAEIQLILGKPNQDALFTGSTCRTTRVPQSHTDLWFCWCSMHTYLWWLLYCFLLIGMVRRAPGCDTDLGCCT